MENGTNVGQGGPNENSETAADQTGLQDAEMSVMVGATQTGEPQDSHAGEVGEGASEGDEQGTATSERETAGGRVTQDGAGQGGPGTRVEHPSGDELPLSVNQFRFVERCLGTLTCYPLHAAARELPSGEIASLSLKHFKREPIGTLKFGSQLYVVEYGTPAARDEVARQIEGVTSFEFKGARYSLTLRRPESDESSTYVSMACHKILSEIVWTVREPSPHDWVNRIHDTYMRYEEGYTSYETVQNTVTEPQPDDRRITMHGQLAQTPKKGPVATVNQGVHQQTSVWGPEPTAVTDLLERLAQEMAALRRDHAQLKVEYNNVKASLNKERGQLTAMDEDGIIDTSGSVERQKQLQAAIESAVTSAVQGAMQGLVTQGTEAPTAPVTQRMVHPQSASTPTGQGRHFPALQGNWMGNNQHATRAAAPPRYIAPQSAQSSPVMVPPANHTIYPVAQFAAPTKLALAGPVSGAAPTAPATTQNVQAASRDGDGLNISIRKETKPPKLRDFTGERAVKNNQASLEHWKADLLMKREEYTEVALKSAIARSVQGRALAVYDTMPPDATIEDILAEFQTFFGTVKSMDALMQEFFALRQGPQEDVATFASRVKTEAALVNKRSPGQIGHQMILNRFANALKDNIGVALAHLKDRPGMTFEELLRNARMQEDKIKAAEQMTAASSQQASAGMRDSRYGAPQDVRVLEGDHTLQVMQAQIAELMEAQAWAAGADTRDWGQGQRGRSYYRDGGYGSRGSSRERYWGGNWNGGGYEGQGDQGRPEKECGWCGDRRHAKRQCALYQEHLKKLLGDRYDPNHAEKLRRSRQSAPAGDAPPPLMQGNYRGEQGAGAPTPPSQTTSAPASTQPRQ